MHNSKESEIYDHSSSHTDVKYLNIKKAMEKNKFTISFFASYITIVKLIMLYVKIPGVGNVKKQKIIKMAT